MNAICHCLSFFILILLLKTPQMIHKNKVTVIGSKKIHLLSYYILYIVYNGFGKQSKELNCGKATFNHMLLKQLFLLKYPTIIIISYTNPRMLHIVTGILSLCLKASNV